MKKSSKFKQLQPLKSTLKEISDETKRARKKFPGNRFILAALTEEVGELAKAILQNKNKEDVRNEAVQVAAMAIRIFEEGDSAFDDLTNEESKL